MGSSEKNLDLKVCASMCEINYIYMYIFIYYYICKCTVSYRFYNSCNVLFQFVLRIHLLPWKCTILPFHGPQKAKKPLNLMYQEEANFSYRICWWQKWVIRGNYKGKQHHLDHLRGVPWYFIVWKEKGHALNEWIKVCNITEEDCRLICENLDLCFFLGCISRGHWEGWMWEEHTACSYHWRT